MLLKHCIWLNKQRLFQQYRLAFSNRRNKFRNSFAAEPRTLQVWWGVCVSATASKASWRIHWWRWNRRCCTSACWWNGCWLRTCLAEHYCSPAAVPPSRRCSLPPPKSGSLSAASTRRLPPRQSAARQSHTHEWSASHTPSQRVSEKFLNDQHIKGYFVLSRLLRK